MYWIVSANDHFFDHQAYFERNISFFRRQRVAYQVGDIVYIYMTQPIGRIQYKARVEEIDLTYDKIRDQVKFLKNEEDFSNSRFYSRFRLIDSSDSNDLSLSCLKSNGLKGAPQGPIRLTNGREKLIEYIEKHFASNHEDYLWVAFYKELADKLDGYHDRKEELFEMIKNLRSEHDFFNYLNFENEEWWRPRNHYIDPYSVMAVMNRGITDSNRTAVGVLYKEAFELTEPAPDHFPGVPLLNNMQSFFTDDENNELWKLFEESLKYAETKEVTEELIGAFDSVRHLKGNGLAKVTIGLFWTRPDVFMPLDSNSKEYISKKYSIEVPSAEKSGVDYFDLLEQLKKVSNQRPFYEISYDAWTDNKESKKVYPSDLTKEDWLKLLKDPEVFNENSLITMKAFLHHDGKATCTQLAQKFGRTKNFYKNNIQYVGERISKATNLEVYDELGKERWWRYAVQGEAAPKDVAGSYMYELRPELAKALKEVDLSEYSLYGKEQEGEEQRIPYSKNEFLNEVYLSENEYHTIRALLKEKKNMILQGPPGVGKTFAAKRLAYSIMGEKDDSRIEFIQFHQNYSYEDFVMGYKPDGEGFILRKGIFVEFAEKAKSDPEKDYFLIIDEINRGNISKIFGELLMAIEADYRGEEVKMPYSGTQFSVPENLYILGMMNTADRSLALIDYALRRRFSFYDMQPGFSTSGFVQYQENLENKTFNQMIERIQQLNIEIKQDPTLGKGFQIGHSYFANRTKDSDIEAWMKRVIEYELTPMLNEYWFDDEEKVNEWRLILTGTIENES